MSQLNFNTGLVTYSINGKSDISFNPTDINFVEQVYKVFSDLDAKQEKFDEERKTINEPKEVFEFARKWDSEIRTALDGLFEKPICDDVFGSMNVFAYADGFPVWANFLFAIIDTMDDTLIKEQKATSPRMNEYLKKYKK